MKKFTLFALLCTAILVCGVQRTGFGQLLLNENFSYPAGDLITSYGWVAHSGGGTQPITVNSSGLTFAGYIASGIGNAALVDNNGEDDNKTFIAQTSGSIYVAFMVKVVANAAGYFFHLSTNPLNTSFFRARVYTDATNHFGIGVGSGAASYSTSTFTVGNTYLLIVKYEMVAGTTNDKVSLFVISGAIPPTEPAATVGPLVDATQTDCNPGSVALRQYSATQNFIIDGIRVAPSWSDVLTAVIPPPANYPTNFAAATAPVTINLSWTDAVGGQLPSGYVVLGSNADNIVPPVNGTPVPNNPNLAAGSGAINVAYGVQAASFTGLPPLTTYYFKIFPYTGSGAEIKYKTDGTPPSAVITTTDHVTVISKNFDDQTFDPWDTISVSSNKGWVIQSTGGNYYAYINGFGGSANSEDWLISPSMNFDASQEENLTFLTASNFTGADLELKISTDYVTGAMPGTGTWSALTFTLAPSGYVWTPSGNVDVSAYNGGNVHIAYRYTGTPSVAKVWEVDNIRITGRPSNVPTVTTDDPVTNITHNSATTGGTVTADGGAAVLSRGVCYSTSPSPTINDPHTTESGTMGHFTSNLSGLTPQTTYYVRAYATSVNGTGYGNNVSFTTLCEPLAPVIDFFADTLVLVMGDSINFFDASLYCPTFWKWSFVGGTPYESNAKNPTNIKYNYPGLYNVCLDASNQYGYSSYCKTGYIRVLGPTNAKLVMTEIMYNPPEFGTDTLEFIEIYNNDSISWNLKDFYFDQGISYVFPDMTMAPEEYILVAKSSSAMQNAFGKTAIQWTDGSLNNNGEPIVIKDHLGFVVDSVYYGVTPPWDTLANGQGPSLELCDPDADNTLPENWRHALEFQLVNAAGDSIWASPAAGCSYPPVAGFFADDTAIVQHEFVLFTDVSTGTITGWEWTFEGGTPETYSGQTPPAIQYNTEGSFDVTLVVSNNAGHSTLVKTDYIEVGPTGISSRETDAFTIYPNPSNGTFKVILKNDKPVEIRIINPLSGVVSERKSESRVNQFSQTDLTPGVYMIQVTDIETKQASTRKLVIQR